MSENLERLMLPLSVFMTAGLTVWWVQSFMCHVADQLATIRDQLKQIARAVESPDVSEPDENWCDEDGEDWWDEDEEAEDQRPPS